MSVVSGSLSAWLQNESNEDATAAQIEAAKISADALKTTSAGAIKAEREMFDISRSDTAPWRTTGAQALNRLDQKVAAGPGEFNPDQDPGYKFGYEEFVEKPTLNLASAAGKLRSGATQKALTRYASDYASTKYDNHLDRYYKSLNPDQSLSGVGLTSGMQSASNAISTGQSIGGNMMSTGRSLSQNALDVGNARATGYINTGNLMASNVKNQGQNALDLYMMYANGGMGG